MNPVQKIKIGWKHLSDSIELLRTGINARTIIKGDGIDVSETPGGVTIAVTKKLDGKPDAATGGSGSGGGDISTPPTGTADWQTIDVIDNSSGHCVIKSIQYWGTAPE